VSAPLQGQPYAEFIEAQLASERERHKHLEAQGLNVITTSGTLTTLVLALVVFLAGDEYRPSAAGQALVVLALVLFVLAAVAGVYANRTEREDVADESSLEHMAGSHWADDVGLARRACAFSNAVTVKSLRHGNDVKANSLTVALALELAAIAVLGGALVAEMALR
jgi:uncharacterized membrane protein YqjE